jgi:hypothetical protein
MAAMLEIEPSADLPLESGPEKVPRSPAWMLLGANELLSKT